MARSAHGNTTALPSGSVRARTSINGMPYKKTFSGENAQKQADAWLKKLHEMRNGVRNGSADEYAQWLMTDFIDKWIARPKMRRGKSTGKAKAQSTTDSYNNKLNLHAKPHIGQFRVYEFDDNVQLIVDFKNKLEATLGTRDCYATISKVLNYTHWILSYAHRLGAIRQNPFDTEDEPLFVDYEPRPKYWLEDFEVEKIVEHIDEWYAFAVLFAAYTGMRAGELWALRRSDYNALRKTIEIRKAVQDIKGKGLVEGPTKNRRPRPQSLPEFLYKDLDQHIVDRNIGPEDLLFTTVMGKQVRHSNFTSDAYKPALVAAELTSKIRFHDLRHYCAHFWIDEGKALEDIKDLLGHSTIAITSNIYGGLGEERRKRNAADINAAYVRRRDARRDTASVTSIVSA